MQLAGSSVFSGPLFSSRKKTLCGQTQKANTVYPVSALSRFPQHTQNCIISALACWFVFFLTIIIIINLFVQSWNILLGQSIKTTFLFCLFVLNILKKKAFFLLLYKNLHKAQSVNDRKSQNSPQVSSSHLHTGRLVLLCEGGKLSRRAVRTAWLLVFKSSCEVSLLPFLYCPNSSVF